MLIIVQRNVLEMLTICVVHLTLGLEILDGILNYLINALQGLNAATVAHVSPVNLSLVHKRQILNPVRLLVLNLLVRVPMRLPGSLYF